MRNNPIQPCTDHLISMSSYNCFRDGCSQKFGSQRAWTQHVRRTHTDDPGTALLTQLVSSCQERKRKQAEEEEEERAAKWQELEVPQEELVLSEPTVCLPSHMTGVSTEQTID